MFPAEKAVLRFDGSPRSARSAKVPQRGQFVPNPIFAGRNTGLLALTAAYFFVLNVIAVLGGPAVSCLSGSMMIPCSGMYGFDPFARSNT